MRVGTLVALLSLLTAASVEGQAADSCSGQNNRFQAPDYKGQCTTWTDDANKEYPADFEGIFSQVLTYKCETSEKRIILSNNIPDHDVKIWRDANPCEIFSVVEIPLDPPNPIPNTPPDQKTEVPIRGMIAMAKNGVPAFGPQESDGLNAVDPTESNKKDAGYWYGHPGATNGWHVHNPHMGVETVDSETFLGWSMDGFKIFGPLPDDIVDDPEDGLDMCNGRFDSEGNYQYHVRTLAQVDEYAEYCDGDSPVTRWNYVFGCYSGDISESRMLSQDGYDLPDDCVLESRGSCTDNPGYFLAGLESRSCDWVADDLDRCMLDHIMDECPVTCGNLNCAGGDGDDDDGGSDPPLNPTTRPNIIIIQPDDLVFMDEWGRPPYSGGSNEMPGGGDDVPHMEDLREGGLQMLQAYTASPKCGTSRYSTITGKMPSRAASIRKKWDPLLDTPPAVVTIPTTKLIDYQGQNDCSAENLAAAFNADNEYDTAMIGKWHLSRIKDEDYTYQHAVDEVEKCGFNHVGGLYIENMVADEEDFNNFSDGTFSHNMEWITYEAIKFINTTVDNDKKFFMYYNPTVPHSSHSVEDAIEKFSCQATADKDYEWPEGKDPWIKGMSEDGGCQEYRDTIIERANGEINSLGPIWLDDAIGAIVQALIDNGVYDDTIIIFQEDHGMDTKSALYEGGVRIPQFVHYPAGIHPGTFNAPVSTIDLAPTLFEYAGISAPYATDGTSWKKAVEDAAIEEDWRTDRCLFFEIEEDRAIRCGCYKYMNITYGSGTWQVGENKGLANAMGGMLFDLCAGDDDPNDYATDKSNIREKETVENESKQTELVGILDCHERNTDPGEDADFTPCYDLISTPTGSPTDSPTNSPTSSPTNSPTSSPTNSPTSSPTNSPTSSPTNSPTSSPTNSPTSSPTDAPSPTAVVLMKISESLPSSVAKKALKAYLKGTNSNVSNVNCSKGKSRRHTCTVDASDGVLEALGDLSSSPGSMAVLEGKVLDKAKKDVLLEKVEVSIDHSTFKSSCEVTRKSSNSPPGDVVVFNLIKISKSLPSSVPKEALRAYLKDTSVSTVDCFNGKRKKHECWVDASDGVLEALGDLSSSPGSVASFEDKVKAEAEKKKPGISGLKLKKVKVSIQLSTFESSCDVTPY